MGEGWGEGAAAVDRAITRIEALLPLSPGPSPTRGEGSFQGKRASRNLDAIALGERAGGPDLIAARACCETICACFMPEMLAQHARPAMKNQLSFLRRSLSRRSRARPACRQKKSALTIVNYFIGLFCGQRAAARL